MRNTWTPPIAQFFSWDYAVDMLTREIGEPKMPPHHILNGETIMAKKPQKNAFEKKFGEGTAFDLDYGKLLIIGLCVYIAFQVS